METEIQAHEKLKGTGALGIQWMGWHYPREAATQP